MFSRQRQLDLGSLFRSGAHTIVAALLAAIVAIPATYADDTEIFFGKSGAGNDSNPNILFVLDTSGSMRNRDGGPTTRMNRLQSAMRILLDQSSDFNVGLMGFNSNDGGGSIRYPIGFLEEDTTSDCPAQGCPDQNIIGRAATSHDDAFEIVSSGVVDTTSDHLPLATLPGAIDATKSAGDSTTATVDAVASVVETTNLVTGEVVNRENQPDDLWFYWGTGDEHEALRFAYRFDNVQIPANATVTEAKITFVFNDTSRQQGDMSAYIYAESSANPAPYPDAALIPTPDPNPQLQERNDSNELIAWEDIPAGVGGEPIDTPELASLLQEIISLPGWASGNSMSIHVDPFDDIEGSVDTTRQFFGVTAESTRVPKLTFTYTTTAETNSGIATQTASAHSLEHFNPSTLDINRDTNAGAAHLFELDENHELGVLGLRFEDLQIPANATITSALLRLHLLNTGPADPNDPGNGNGNGNGVPGGPPGTFDISINAELSDIPADFGLTDLRERNYSSNFIDWIAVPEGAGLVEESPNIRDLIQDVVSQPTWDEDSSMVLTVNPSSTLDSRLSRQIVTSTGFLKPELEISWTTDSDVDAADSEDVLTGLRFDFVHVPPGAKITRAFIRMDSHRASDTATTLTIAAEDSSESAPFQETPNDISSRTLTVARETWQVEEWPEVAEPYDSIDVTRLVQEVTTRTDWCGGNPLTMIISGTGYRQVVANDQDQVATPRLFVDYDPNTVPTGSFCSNRNFVADIAAANDDIYQDASGAIVANDSAIPSIGDVGGQIGLRFDSVNVDQGAIIRNATLQLIAANDVAEGAAFNIEIENSINPDPYGIEDNTLSNRSYLGTSVNWQSIPATAAGASLFSTDVTELVEAITSNPNWQSQNSMALRLTQTAGSEPVSIYSQEGDEALSASLLIYYESTRDTPGSLVRDNLIAVTDSLVARGSTPIVSSLYEASSYFMGESVDYGTRRGRQLNANRFSRVSHPESYTGGTVSRDVRCTDDNLNSSFCRNEIITGSPVYDSPIIDACQQSHVVLLSDGRPTSNTAQARVRNRIGGSCALPDSNSEACGLELANWMHNNDLSNSLPGQQGVTTHTIAFNLNEPKFLEDLAAAGEGGYYEASSSSELLNAFQSIFVNVSKTATSFVAPSVSVDQFNRLKNREEIYFAQFRPSSTARWEGNLKKYKLIGEAGEAPEIVDSTGTPAIDETTAQFRADSISFWGTVQDGGNVTEGGAAAQLDIGSRDIYTLTGLDGTLNKKLTDFENRVDVGNTDLDINLFNLPTDLATDLQYRQDLINWTAGLDSQDEDADGITNEYREHMGDLMHSQPIVIDYSEGTGTRSIIYAGTNEGYLHAIDNLTGIEQYAFIPPELLRNMRRFYENDRQSINTYGVDGPISAWLSDENNNGRVDPNETAILYFGLRRGGRNYYALDISKPESPELAFVIEGGKGDYSELSQSWSRINKAKIRNGDEEVDVIIFAGGYDPNQDPGDTSGTENPVTGDFGANGARHIDGSGRGIFIADARTGELIWTSSLADPTFSAMQYSIPTDLRIIDISGDGLVDQIYFADMGGQIWRMDIDNRNDNTNSLDLRITAGVIAELGGDDPDDAARFYYPPDVALVNVNGNLQLSVSVGSGWRAHPLQTYIEDRFYSFRMDDVFTAPRDSFGQINYPTITDTSGDLLDVTDLIDADVSGYRGWFITLESNGEKALSSSLTIDNKVVFTTYTPTLENDSCAAAVGQGAVYVVDVLNGDPVVGGTESSAGLEDSELNKSHRKQVLINAGIPTTPTVVFPTTGEPSVLVGPETLDQLELDTLKTRSFWQEHVDDNS